MEDTEKEGVRQVSPTAKREYLEGIRPRYQRAGKREKGLILDEFCEVCGYDRKHAIRLLKRITELKRKRSGRREDWPGGDHPGVVRRVPENGLEVKEGGC